MKRVNWVWAVALFSLAVLGLNAPGNAAEIIYQDDIVQNVVTKDVLVRTADNVIVLVDASSSMDFSHRKYKKTNYTLEQEALAAGSMRLPDLGYNVGVYNFSPAWKEIYPVQKFDRAKLSEAMKQLPAKPINELQRHVSGLILVTIATQQPVARDLRYLLTLDHVASELERMGDHAGSVAKQARHLAPEPPLQQNMHLAEMATLAADNLHAVLRCLVDADPDQARLVARRDDDLDVLWHRTWDEVAALMRESPDNVDRGMRIMLAAHYIERIGDRTTNIAEDGVYLATGEIEDLNP